MCSSLAAATPPTPLPPNAGLGAALPLAMNGALPSASASFRERDRSTAQRVRPIEQNDSRSARRAVGLIRPPPGTSRASGRTTRPARAPRAWVATHAGPEGARTGDFVRQKHLETAHVSLV